MKIVKYGDPVLRAKGARIEAITDDIRALAEAMVETMREANGVGLAAQQVGEALQMAIVDVGDVEDRDSVMWIDGEEADIAEWSPMVLLNPVLELSGDKELGQEGCLSFPGIVADIPRSPHVKATATLIDGRQVTFEAEGLLAVALQHEVDHLNGVLFIDRMSSAAKVGIAGKLKRLQRDAKE